MTAPTLLLALPSAFALGGYAWAARAGHGPALRTVLLAAWMAHALALIADVLGLGSGLSGARFGFAPALSLTLWLVIAVYGVESRWLPLPGVRRVLAGLGVLAVALAWAFPGEARPHASSPWAPAHWVLGFASYGLFGAAVLHAAMWSHNERLLRLKPKTVGARPGEALDRQHMGMPLLKLEALTFGFVKAGFVALTATLVLGWWFSRPWQWDHKSVFSVLAWLVFAALLTGRLTLGWRGKPATRWLYAGSSLLLLAYVGSRFVLEIVLRRPPGSY